jgi:hypothetical protein
VCFVVLHLTTRLLFVGAFVTNRLRFGGILMIAKNLRLRWRPLKEAVAGPEVGEKGGIG